MSSNGTETATAAAAVSSTTQSRTARSSSQNRNETTKAAASSSSLKDMKTPSSGLFNSLRGNSTANTSQNGNTTRSPTSPSRITRLQEKEEMQNLNDRLVIYIDTVRRLESENSRLQNIVQSYSEHSTRDVTEIKQLYERELEDAKRLIDELAKDKARYEIEVNKHKANAQEAITKFERRDKEHRTIETKLKTLESEYAEYKTRCEIAQNDLGHFQAELAQLRPHASELEKQLNKLKKQLEDETLLRVDLENKNTSLKEDLHFKSQIYDKETDQLRSSKRIEIEQVDGRLRDEYDSKLVSELQRIRDETEYKIREMKDEVERRYQNKFSDAESQAKRATQQATVLREEISSYRSKLEETQTDITNLQKKLSNNEGKIKELEDKLKKSHNKYDQDIADKDAEIDTVRKEMTVLLTDYQELYDIKIALDMEIAAYRKLLESEEQRLNISTSMAASNLHNSYLNESSMLGGPSTTRGNNKKRRLAQGDEEQAVIEPSTTYNQSSESKSGILIAEHDLEGNSVILSNPTDVDIPMGNWVIKRSSNDGGLTEYKFSKNSVIKSQAQITVWSNSAPMGKNEPPSHIVMKTNWSAGDKMITVLSDKEGNEQSRRESQKEVKSVISIEKRQRTSTASMLEVHTVSAEKAPKSAVSKIFGNFFSKS